MVKTLPQTEATVFVSEPYREVCYVCRHRTQVRAVHVPNSLTEKDTISTRLCHCCSLVLARLLLVRQEET